MSNIDDRIWNIFVINDMTYIQWKMYNLYEMELIWSIRYKVLDQVCIVTKVLSSYEICLLWYEIYHVRYHIYKINNKGDMKVIQSIVGASMVL